jgi:hypothetical protein
MVNKTLLALAAAASIAAVTVSAPAQAGCFGCAVGAGLFGGLVAGTIIGSAAAANAPPPGYYGPGPYGPPPGPGCHYTRRPVWDPYAGAYRPGPRVLVCP